MKRVIVFLALALVIGAIVGKAFGIGWGLALGVGFLLVTLAIGMWGFPWEKSDNQLGLTGSAEDRKAKAYLEETLAREPKTQEFMLKMEQAIAAESIPRSVLDGIRRACADKVPIGHELTYHGDPRVGAPEYWVPSEEEICCSCGRVVAHGEKAIRFGYDFGPSRYALLWLHPQC